MRQPNEDLHRQRPALTESVKGDVFVQFPPWHGEVAPGWTANFLGVLIRESFFTDTPSSTERRHVWPPLPAVDDEYLDWINLLEAVTNARGTFTMVDLGAGYGRWLTSGAAAAQRLGIRFRLVGVEAEPSHFRWMKKHLRDNGVPGPATTPHRAAVATFDGPTGFTIGDPRRWYGQAITEMPGLVSGIVRRLRSRSPRKVVTVTAMTLATILRDLDVVDLVQVDIQGLEADVLEAGADVLGAKVKRVHIRTHSRTNEERLRVLFERLQWATMHDYPAFSTSATPWGSVTFAEGVQTWINRQL